MNHRGKLIVEAREKAGLSQAQVADQIGISQQAYSNIETGRTKNQEEQS